MPSKSEIWKEYKNQLANIKGEIPQRFSNIDWRTPKQEMEAVYGELLAFLDTQYEHIDVDIKGDSARIDFNTPLTHLYVPEVKRVVERMLQQRTKYNILLTIVKDDGDDVTKTFSSSTDLASFLYEDRYEDEEERKNKAQLDYIYRLLVYGDDESLWPPAEKPDERDPIIIEIIEPELEPPVPAMAFSSSLNCVLKQCFQQTHRKVLLKESPGMFMTLNDIKALEDKYKINVFITDNFNKLWRKPAVRHKKKSQIYPVDVFIKCHNFHATKAFPIKAFSLPEEKNKSYPGQLISNFHIGKAPTSIKYLTQRELANLHIDLLKQNIEHHIIDTGKEIIGLIGLNPLTYYKNCSIEDYKFITSTDWSLSGYARRVYKQSLLNNPTNHEEKSEYRLQISDPIVYENIHKSQTPITVLFQQKAEGNIIQIDQTQAYKNASIGNLDKLPKQFYRGFPSAPRNIININAPLTTQLLKKLSTLGLGFALITFDQSHHISTGRIPLLHTGRPHPKGETVLSLPALEYYSLYSVEVFVKQYYYSTLPAHDPFQKPMKKFDQLLKSLEDQNQYKQVRGLGNLLIGGLNKKHHKCKVFSTCSLAECQRFLADDTKRVRRFKKVQRQEERIKILDKEEGVTLHDEYIFYYQEKSEEIVHSFNMTHLSKYVLDYQKIALHFKALQVTKNKIENLLCINTDSITYRSPFNNKLTDKLTDKEEDKLTDKLWHLEAKGNKFYGYSNGVRAISNMSTEGEELVHARRSGHKRELTLDDYKVLSDNYNLKVYRQTKKYNLAEEYSTTLENTPLPDQKLHTLFRPAGYGKTEFAKYLSGKKSEFQLPKDTILRQVPLPPLRVYKPDEILLTGTTHVSRKLIEGKYTLTGLITRLQRNVPVLTENSRAILVDEISMSSDKQIQVLDRLLRRVKKCNRPFGGLDIYLVGHMKQLPNPDPDTKPVTDNILVKSVFTSINEYLPVNRRQSTDKLYQSILTKIEAYYDIGGDERSNHKAKNVLAKILTTEELQALTTRITRRVPIRDDYFATPLHFKNSMVEKSNKSIGKSFQEKKGEEVIIRFNRGNKFFNGDRHLIQETKGHEVSKSPEEVRQVKINGTWLDYDKYFFRQKDEKFPRIQLAYSLTIHCSQGQTLDKVFLYAKSLTMNMLYVAMSRVRDLNSLYLANLI